MRTKIQKIKDFIFFPLRALVLFEKDRFGLSSPQTERYEYVAPEVEGKCLDVGCGRNNRFVKKFLNGAGIGIDVYKYEGLEDRDIVCDMTKLPYDKESFRTVTLIANINHIPRSIREKELKELYRVIENGGRIVVTMGNPLMEIVVHKVLWSYDKYFKSHVDVDSERGMKDDEEYYLTDIAIRNLLTKAGFKDIRKKYFLTQWCFNHLFVAKKIA